jgi:hypothetical protein
MDHIRLESQDEAVRRFVLSLKLDSGGTMLELNGQAVACIVPVTTRNGEKDSDWTDAKNNRRCALIDRKSAGTLTAQEAVELHTLQEEMHRFLDRVAPLPLEETRRLHQDLMRKTKDLAKP